MRSSEDSEAMAEDASDCRFVDHKLSQVPQGFGTKLTLDPDELAFSPVQLSPAMELLYSPGAGLS